MTDVGHWAVSEPDEPDYECDDCDASFHDEESLRDHEVMKHFCDRCDRDFQNWKSINQHLSSIRAFSAKLGTKRRPAWFIILKAALAPRLL